MQASDLTDLMTSSAANVLDSMYFATVNSTAVESAATQPDDAITYTLRFAGDISGTFGLSVDPSAALTMAANFLGEDESDLSPTEVADVVGEMSNMLCGSLVSGIASGQKFALSHPEPFHASPSSETPDTIALKLDTDYGIVRVWVAVDENAGAL